jgi:hypothetical protein
MQKKKLTIGLILLIICIGVLGFSRGVRSVSEVEKAYRPYYEKFPSLSSAVTLAQLLVASGMLAWVYSAWLLYNREPGTLGVARNCFLLGALLRLASGYVLVLSSGFPSTAVQKVLVQFLPSTMGTILFTAAVSFYLWRSERVKEIYTA